MNLMNQSDTPNFLTIESTTTPDIFSESYLEEIKIKIENMSKLQHIEVLKIIKKYKTIKLNENKNGVYINISYLPKKTIQELELYIKYIDDQTSILNQSI